MYPVVEHLIFTFMKHLQAESHNGQEPHEPMRSHHGQLIADAKHFCPHRLSKNNFSSVAGLSLETLRGLREIDGWSTSTLRVDDSSQREEPR
jgi:hypothetical protein